MVFENVLYGFKVYISHVIPMSLWLGGSKAKGIYTLFKTVESTNTRSVQYSNISTIVKPFSTLNIIII